MDSGAYDIAKQGIDPLQPVQPDSEQLEGPLLLFHDLKLAFARLVSEYEQASREYAEVSDLFKFAVDLLLREAHRLSLVHLGAGTDRDDAYLARISAGFQTISAEIQEPNNETFYVTAANGPLFMSASNKAPVDPRDTAVAGSVHTVKLLPHIARAPESTLGFTSPLHPRFPQPNAPPTEILSTFVHPNSHQTVPPLWLASADDFGSFAPSSDFGGAVVTSEDAAIVWDNRRKVYNAKCAANPPNKASPANPDPANKDPANPAPANPAPANSALPTNPANPANPNLPTNLNLSQPNQPNQGQGQSGQLGHQDQNQLGQQGNISNPANHMPQFGQPQSPVSARASPLTGPHQPHQPPQPPQNPLPQLPNFSPNFQPVQPDAQPQPQPQPQPLQSVPALTGPDLELLLRWSPYSFVDDDEIEAARSGSEHALVSRLLLELQFMQRERLSAPGIELEIGEAERHVALKTANVLGRLVERADNKEIDLKLDTRLPVIMRNYAGSLPAATDPALRVPQPVYQQPRLQTLQGMRQNTLRRPSRR